MSECSSLKYDHKINFFHSLLNLLTTDLNFIRKKWFGPNGWKPLETGFGHNAMDYNKLHDSMFNETISSTNLIE